MTIDEALSKADAEAREMIERCGLRQSDYYPTKSGILAATVAYLDAENACLRDQIKRLKENAR